MRKTILIVDDDANFLDVIGEFLVSEGYEVTTTISPHEALKLFKKTGVHIVLLDQQMPEMKGTELALKLKDIDDTVKIIMLTAFPDIKNAIALIKDDIIVDYLTKPIDLADLTNTLKHIFNEIRLELMEGATAKVHKADRVELPETKYFKEILDFVKIASKVRSPVLLTGETGTGKNYIARLIHRFSRRERFVALNCAAVPESIFESELFGVEKGAFTGAITRRGMFELAEGGTLFLDEIGEMPLSLQAKILDAIERLKIRRVGGEREIPVDVRIISATNLHPDELIDSGKFRKDLYFRLNVLHFHIAPLRERKEDIEVLAHVFIKEFYGKDIRLKEETLKVLKEYPWPGNIRELKNVIERSYILSMYNGEEIDRIIISELKNRYDIREGEVGGNKILPLAELEKNAILHALSVYNGNKSKAAKALGISLSTLKRKLKKYQY